MKRKQLPEQTWTQESSLHHAQLERWMHAKEETSPLSFCHLELFNLHGRRVRAGVLAYTTCSPPFPDHQAQTPLPVVQEDKRCDARLTFIITATEGPLDRIPNLEGEGVTTVILTRRMLYIEELVIHVTANPCCATYIPWLP